ncbi:LysR family transcriptional regulator [Bacillota bacterium Meth-B3]
MKAAITLTLRHLNIFVTVCEEDSITKAAQKLHIAQPAVSLAVKELEEYYDVKLFDRISRRLYLTDAGRKLLEYAAHIVSLLGDMENNIRQWERSGKLRIGASITIGTRLMPRYVRAFHKSHPESNIEVHISSSDLIEKKILQSELDLALIEGVVHSDSIIDHIFMKDRLAVICAPSCALCEEETITIEQLLSQPLLLRESGSGTRELFDHVMASFERTYTPSWESTSTEALVHAVRNGLGVSVLPYMLVQDKLKKGSIVELKVAQLHFDRGFHIIYHKNKLLTSLAREFIEMCRNSGVEA